MVANQKSLTDRLNTVKANITGLKALAEANEKAHNEQVVALYGLVDPDGNVTVKGARSQWKEVFDEVANSEQSSAHEAAIKELTEIKKKLDAYETAIADNFAKLSAQGQSRNCLTDGRISTMPLLQQTILSARLRLMLLTLRLSRLTRTRLLSSTI